MKKLAKLLCVVLSLVLVGTVFAGCGKVKDETPTYTYQDYTSGNPNTWNPHTWQAHEDSYIMNYTQIGLYDFALNAEKTGYEIVPEMAADMAVDVTAQYKGKFGIDDDKVEEGGYAYKIPLNPNAKWDDGTPITADDWVYSAQQMLSSNMQNYRASTMFEGQLVYYNAKNYFQSKAPIYEAIVTSDEQGNDVVADVPEGAKRYFSLSKNMPYLAGMSFDTLYGKYVGGSFSDLMIKDPADPDKEINAIDAIMGAGNAAKADKLMIDLSKLDNGYGVFEVTDELSADMLVLANATLIAVFDATTQEDLFTMNDLTYIMFYQTGTGAEVSWDSVGIQKTGEYELTIMLESPIKGFYLYYNLASPWLVKKDVYEASKVKAPGSEVFSSNYCTTAENTPSFGPYKLTRFQLDKEIYMERNDNWYGWTDGKHAGQFMTTAIRCTIINSQATALSKFLKGELDTIALTSGDMDKYRQSKYTLYTPDSSTWKLSFNMDEAALLKNQNAANKGNKTIMANSDFRKAIGLSINKEEFVAQNFPASKPAFGLINYMYVYDPDTGALYRDSEQAKKQLVEYYGLEYGEGKKYATLDDAYKAMTGYDKEEAKRLFQKAYDDMIAASKMQAGEEVTLDFNMYSGDAIYVSVFNFIDNAIQEATKGTSLEGKIKLNRIVDADFYKTMKKGGTEIIMSAWAGANFDPWGIASSYLDPDKSNEYGFPFDKQVTYAVKAGESYTLSLADWSTALNGTLTREDGTELSFTGRSSEEKLGILAMLEREILETNITVPMWYVTGASMDSMRIKNALDEYMQLIGYGGVRYLTYTYSDQEWKDFTNNYSKQLDYTVTE